MNKPVLVACEFSAIVRDALRATGIDAWSNDLLDTEGDPRYHIKGDCKQAISLCRWGLVIIHPECTAMATCGNKTYSYGSPRYHERAAAIADTINLWELCKANADCVALENPASVIFPFLRKRKALIQFVQPWQFGHVEQKATGFALHRLPPLRSTHNVFNRLALTPSALRNRVHQMPERLSRSMDRSRTYPGIADAIARQWGAWAAL